MRNKLCLLSAILALLLLCGCSGAQTDENAVSSRAQQVITTMLTAPNDDLRRNIAGLFSDFSCDSKSETAGAAKDEFLEKWDDAVGKCFTDDGLEAFVDSGLANSFLTMAYENDVALEVVSMTLVSRDDQKETVDVTYSDGSSEYQVSFVCHMGDGGKFTQIDVDPMPAVSE